MQSNYAQLSSQIRQSGLLERQYGYYLFKTMLTIGMLLAGIAGLFLIESALMQIANAVFLAFVFVQFGMLMHDAEHLEIFKSKRNNRLAGLFFGNLLIGVSGQTWKEKHNRHHSSPNDTEHDPDVNVAFIAYSEEQALQKKGILRFIVKYQAHLWFILTMPMAVFMRAGNFITIARNLLNRKSEFLMLAIHHVLYFSIIFSALGLQGIWFIAVHQMLMGLYMGTVFATNHKGMPMLSGEMRTDFLLNQVLTTRNVAPSVPVTIWTGGLNYQIEHHLFPTMPRNNFGKAQKIIRKFCEEKGIKYYETGFFNSYKEILMNYYKVSKVLRQPKANPGYAPAEQT